MTKAIREQIERLEEHWAEKSRSAFDCANCGVEANMIMEAADTMEKMLAVVEIAATIPRDYNALDKALADLENSSA